MRGLAIFGFILLLLGGPATVGLAAAEDVSLTPPVFLPDGTEF